MHLPLLTNIAIALGLALAAGLLARRLGIPTIVGYMVAGLAISPNSPFWVGDVDAIHQFAEFGVVLLMFGVGLHFSFKDLWRVRHAAVPGSLIHMALGGGAGYLLARAWGWTPAAAIVLGVTLSVASTVVLLKNLMDRAELETPAGRTAVGWLVVEDIATIIILVLLPILATDGGDAGWTGAGFALLKATVFVIAMLVVGNRLVPFILIHVAHTRSRELFVLAAITIALGTALASAEFFGVSLALGAFVAGVVVSESPLSHQVAAELLPFREAFAVLFFVSVGMLVDPVEIVAYWPQILALSTLVIVGKYVFGALVSFALPYPARTGLVVAAGLSQIGEFSFVVGQSGIALGLLDATQYSLILATAIVSISVNPLMFKTIEPVERWLRGFPRLWTRVNEDGVAPPPVPTGLRDHVVIVGCGRVGRHVASVLGQMDVPRLVVESDPERLEKLRDLGVPVLYGDAANSEILQHAALKDARAVVITVPEDTVTQMVVEAVHRYAPHIHIVARASSWAAGHHLRSRGVHDVVRPELEGGVEMVRQTLLELQATDADIQHYTDQVRRSDTSQQ
ncbi:MAG: cation:proton antiporter [Acidobacteria bacterium]|nr:cation:proton antiporter [Acidobacteriota bacterium]